MKFRVLQVLLWILLSNCVQTSLQNEESGTPDIFSSEGLAPDVIFPSTPDIFDGMFTTEPYMPIPYEFTTESSVIDYEWTTPDPPGFGNRAEPTRFPYIWSHFARSHWPRDGEGVKFYLCTRGQ
jgi:hypothetical protein